MSSKFCYTPTPLNFVARHNFLACGARNPLSQVPSLEPSNPEAANHETVYTPERRIPQTPWPCRTRAAQQGACWSFGQSKRLLMIAFIWSYEPRLWTTSEELSTFSAWCLTQHQTEVRMLTVEVFSGSRPCHRQGGHAGSGEEVGCVWGLRFGSVKSPNC